MKKLAIVVLALTLCLMLGGAAQATPFYAATDRVSYTGTLTKYNTLADAQNQTNAIGTYTIPNRSTAYPYDTAYRDLSLFVVKDVPSVYQNFNAFLTAWSYTTAANTNIDPSTGLVYPKDDPLGDRLYSGYGNPNNTNTGFVQLYDSNFSTVSSADARFQNYNGSYYTEFNLQMTGANADYANDWARLWPAPLVGGAGDLSKALFHSYALDITFTGLQGQYDPSLGLVKSTDELEGVYGSFLAIAENVNTNPDGTEYLGFYRTELTFGMDNWAFGMGDEALNGNTYTSEFAAVPLPGTLMLLGSGLVGLASLRWRRRRAVV